MSDVIVPETTPIPRLLLLFAARGECHQALAGALPGLRNRLRDASAHPLRAIGLVRQRPDPFAGGVGENRGFDAGLDLRLEAGGDTDSLIDAARGVAAVVSDDVHVDLSYALAGPIHVVMKDDDSSVRYVYLMRRRADWTDADYAKHYAEHHIEFGLRTPALGGYSQHRIDLEASQRAARATGLGCWSVNSVSELYIPSLDAFFRDAMDSEVGREAIADEERFVDRGNSVACGMDVVFDVGRS